MAQKPETLLIKDVHDRLDKNVVFAEKTNNPYRAGIADCYYEHRLEGLVGWIEYKWLPRLPREFCLAKGLNEGKSILTKLQDSWLWDRRTSGLFTAVAVGFKEGSEKRLLVYFDGEWRSNAVLTKEQALELSDPITRYAKWIPYAMAKYYGARASRN